MYRQYENPKHLKQRLEEALKQRESLIDTEVDLDVLISINETIGDLKERINFAWQDANEEA